MEFDRAWDLAYANVKWPHDKVHRTQWKAIIEADRHNWAAAYGYVAPRPAQAACRALVPA